MLLSVLLLAETGRLLENKVLYSSLLVELFRSIFAVVRRDNDQPTSHNPFFHLKREGFWHLHPNPGMDMALQYTRQVKGPSQLKELVAFASLDAELFMLIKESSIRHEFQALLIQTYLSHAATAVWQVLKDEVMIAAHQNRLMDAKSIASEKVVDRVRSTAFRRLIRDLYDVRCAACGLRFFYDDVDVIDAAHLIPFSVSGDDRPQNGMALCKNHHWLMDHAILAPGPGRGGDYKRPVWHLRPGLDNRLEEHRAVLELKGRTVLLPHDQSCLPAREGMDWRMDRLLRDEVVTETDYAE